MPFDISLPQDVQNLLTLADALEREHEGFEWDFRMSSYETDCGTAGCAIGLAFHIGLQPYHSRRPELAAFFGLTMEQLHGVFFGIEYTGSDRQRHPDYGHIPMREVTPAMVAAELRRIAAEKMGR